MSDNMENVTGMLLCLILDISKSAVIGSNQIADIGNFVKVNFDKLELSRLQRDLRENNIFEFFNGCMAHLNKYHSFPKEMIPFELDLQDYVLADKIMKKIS